MQSRCIPYANIGIKKDSASYLPRNRLKTVTSHKKKDCRHAIFRHIDSPSLFVIFRESGLFWPKPPISGFLDIIHNPLPDFRRSVTLPAFHLDFRRTHIGIQRSIHSLAYQCAFFLQIKVLEQHGHGKNLGQRIGYVQSLGLRPRTMNRFKNRRMLTRRSRRQQAHGTGDTRALVRMSPKVFSVTITSKKRGS